MQKEIIQIEQINKVIDKLFGTYQVYMMVEGKPIPVIIIGNTENGLKIKSPDFNLTSSQRVLTLSNKENLFICLFQYIGADDSGYDILKPIKINIGSLTDKSWYKGSMIQTSSSNVHVTEIINYNDVGKHLNDDKIKKIVKDNAIRLKHMFTFYKVVILDRHDNRIRLMHNHNKSIFIPNLGDMNTVTEDFVPYHEYAPILKGTDIMINYKSEICIPIKYRNHAIIGYIQVLHANRLDINSYNVVKLVSSSINREVSVNGGFETSKEICSVTEFSKEKIVFVHPHTVMFNKIFSVKDSILFDIADGKKRHTFRGTIAGLKPLESNFKIECQIQTSSPNEIRNLEDFLNE
ncbi:MAG: hypothetical protein H7A23_02340 [Leptospiraceae bacterium]|nr:hypothetical protein [Leptospiraceae bacterium]MCP5493370.1 hypothetical protein [Leptospiraceae bacterium]